MSPSLGLAVGFLALSLTMVSPLPYPAFRERHLGKYKTWAFLAVIIFVLAIFLIRPSQVQLAFIAYALANAGFMVDIWLESGGRGL